MRKSKLIVLLVLVMLFVFILSAAMVACDVNGGDDNDENETSGEPTKPPIPPNPPSGDTDVDDDLYLTPREALTKILDGIGAPENALNLDFQVKVDMPDTQEILTIAVLANIYSEVRNEILVGFYMQGKDEPDENRELKYALYIVNGKAYIDLGKDENGQQRALLYLADFNMNYIMAMLEKAPELLGDLVPMLEQLLKDNNINITFDGILEMVIPMLFLAPELTANEETGALENIHMEITLRDFIGNITSVLGIFGATALPVDINTFLQYLLNDVIPDARFYLDADLDPDGKITDLELSSIEGSQTNKVQFDMTISETAGEVPIPEIEELEISEFSLTNINFAIDFTLGTRENADGTKTQLDVGKIINGFMGQNILPLDVLLLEGGTGLRMKVALDLDLNYENAPEDNNKIAIELFLIDQYGNYQEFVNDDPNGQPAPQMGIYYTDGSFYLNLDNLLPNYMKGVNVKIDAGLTDLIDALVTLITDAIDGVFGISYDDIKNSQMQIEDNGKISTTSDADVLALLSSAAANGTQVLALNGGVESETMYISAGVQGFIAALAELLKLPENIKVDEDSDSILVIVNNDFLASLNSLMATNENPQPIKFAFPDYMGDIVLSVNISDIGLESVAVDASIRGEDGAPVFDVGVKIWDFLIGTAKENLDVYISDRVDVDNTSYLTSLNGVIDKVLGGITMSSRFTMSFNKGVYDLAPFIAGFGVSQLAKTELLWTFTEDFMLDAQLNVQIALNKEDAYNSQLVVELKTLNGIKVGDTEVIAPNTVMIGIYGYHNQIFIDLSNLKVASITLPKLSFTLNFSDLVYTLLGDTLNDLLAGAGFTEGDLPFEFDLVELLGLNKGSGDGSESTVSTTAYTADGSESGATDDGSLAIPEEELNAILFGLNCDEIYATVSLAAIMTILSQTQTELGNTIAEALELMELDLSLRMGRKDGFEFNFAGELIPMQDENGNAVYYYSKDDPNVLLPCRDENGEKIYYEEGEYSRKVYNYGSDMKLSFVAGDEENPIIVGDLGSAKFDMEEKIKEFSAYQSDLVQAIVNTVGKATIRAKVDLATLNNEMNLTNIINNILASTGKKLDLPINLDLDDWNSFVELVVQWDLDLKNSANSTVVLTLSYEGKQIFGIYIYRNSLMLDLEGLGFFQVEIVNTDIITKLFSALDGIISEIEGLDLNEIINDLLEANDLPTIPGAGEELPEGEIASEDGEGAALDDTTMDIIKYVLQAVGFEDTKVTINLTAALFAEMLNTLAGMNLGIDISLAADLDLFGGNAFNFDVGVEDITASINMQLAIGEAPTVNINYDDIPDWDATNGETFTRSLLDNLNIGFTLDIANFTADTEVTEGNGQAIYTRVIIEKLTTSRTLTNTANSITIPKGCFLITLAHIDKVRYENANTGEFTPLVYIVLDYTKTSGQMRVILCKGVVSLIVDLGDFVDISVDLDLVGMLSGTFDNLFSQIDSALDGIGSSSDSGSGSEVPPTEDPSTGGGDTESGDGSTTPETEPTGFDKIFADLDIVALLGGGINASLLSNGNFGINVTFDTYLINKLIDDVMSLIFGPETILNLAELAPDMFSDNYLSYVNWTREIEGQAHDGVSFWGTLSEQVVPILKDLVSSLGYGWVAPLITNALINGVLGQVRGIVAGILPFAVFNEMTVNVEVADATLANVSIEGFDWGQDIYDTNGNVAYSASKSGRFGSVNNNSVINRDGYFTSIKLYNTSQSVGNPVTGEDGSEIFPEGIVTWDGIPMQITYDPYSYENNTVGVATLIRDNFSGKQASYQRAQDLYKATVVFKIVSENGVPCDKEVSALNLDTPGTYVIEGTAAFNNGVTRKITTTITALGLGNGIESIDAISMHVYDELPDFVTINLNDGSSRKIHTRYIKFTENAPTAFTAHSVTGKASFANGTVVDVEFNYLDSTIVQINLEGAEGNVINIDLYDYSIRPGQSSITDYISDIVFFKYADGLSTGLEISKDWTTTGAEDFFNRNLDVDGMFSTNVDGAQFSAYTTIGSGATEQRVELIFSVKTKNVAKLTINGLENTLRVDPYRYYMYLITGDEQYNPFTNVATAEYYDKYMSADGTQEIIDSYSEEVNITWGDYSGIDFSWDNNSTQSQQITVSLDNMQYPTSSFTWNFDTQIVVLRNEIEKLYFDKELTQTTYYIDPFEYFINEELGIANYPDHAYVQFTNGNVYYMPIEWIGTEDFEVKYANQFTQLKIRIGMDYEGKLENVIGNFIQEKTVNVRVENLNPVGIDLAGSEYTGGTYYIDPIRVNYYNEPAFPDTVTVVYDNGKTTELPVASWEYDGLDITSLVGQKNFKATAVITDSYRYDINVEVIDRSGITADLADLKIDPYDYTLDEKGNRVYDEFTKTILVYQKVGTINLDTLTVIGDVNVGTMASTSEYKYYFSYIINYTQTVEGEVKNLVFTTEYWQDAVNFISSNKAAIDSTEVRACYNTPVTWDLSEINYAVPDTYIVRAQLGSGNNYKAFRINAEIVERKIKQINNTYYTINWGGTNLTEEQKLTNKIVTKMNVFFEDGYSGNYECTIDISSLAYTNEDDYTLLMIFDGVNVTYQDNTGKVLQPSELYDAALDVPVTVFSGDIAVKTTMKVHILKQQINITEGQG